MGPTPSSFSIIGWTWGNWKIWSLAKKERWGECYIGHIWGNQGSVGPEASNAFFKRPDC